MIWAAYVSLLAALAMAMWKVLRAAWKDRDVADSARHPRDLLGAVHVTFRIAAERIMLLSDNPVRLRMTIYRVSYDAHGRPSEQLEQLIPFVGAPGDSVGTTISYGSGLIGKAMDVRGPHDLSWDGVAPAVFAKHLRDNYHMNEKDIEKMIGTPRSWLVIPFKSGNKFIGALYCDAADPQVFKQDVSEVIIQAAAGIVEFINEAYA